MKIFHYTTLALSLSLLTISCNKDFLDRSNKTAVTDQNFFKTPEDLKTYTNGFYRFIGASYDDIFTDNIGGFTGSSSTNNMLRGTLTPGNASGWSDEWKNLRRINYMMDHLGTVTGDQAQIDHYVGIARFFRAYIYFNLVRDYNNVPWYDTALGAEDEAMYKDQDSREVVVKHIMEDLEFAAAHIREDKVAGNFKERVTQGAALTLLARIALHEGTFRKYHEELNLQTTADEFLKRAASASQEVINSGKYKIHNTGAKEADFRTLFSSNNLSSNTEAIFIQKNDRSLGIANNSHTVLDWQWALSGELMEEFLTADGKSFTSTPDYKTKTFTQIFQNRDPRLAETIMPAGFKTDPNNPTAYLIKPSFGGYLQIKFYPRDPALRGGWEANYTDLPIMRYAEVLLINAEAKAELGTLTQADLDATVNVLRGRVGVPALQLAIANAQVDPVLAARYSNAQGANKGALLEIRRERRVELACEGFRFNDVLRWKTGDLLAVAPHGIYVPALGAMDVTGDGNPDIAILENEKATGPIDQLPEAVKTKLVKYYLDGGAFYLSNGTSGYIMMTVDQKNKRSFVSPKYYYKPIPLGQITLNPNLKQVFGWDK